MQLSTITTQNNVKIYTSEKFQDLIDNISVCRTHINDNNNHHYAIFFKDGKLKWLEKGGYWCKFTNV
jgi:hypothetical protein